ncbi:PR domain zinc finger protein 15-like [Paramacrobiotus metropolitanus]|uniref:PR domain zinc finger protein 15-like n=1 Tax=Paramacrobiotus metropolitanus TaxID=2943436 RepID=UPI0024463EFD|nr:PR domain zinc finger protein 15-like [Paramacrobiotus metropolitanus]
MFRPVTLVNQAFASGEMQYLLLCPNASGLTLPTPPPSTTSFVPIKPRPGPDGTVPDIQPVPTEATTILLLQQQPSSPPEPALSSLLPDASPPVVDQCVLCSYRTSDSTCAKRAVFKFPKDALRRKKWVDVCRQVDELFYLSPTSFVCQEHFAPQYIRLPLLRNGKQRKRLSRFAVPSLPVATAAAEKGVGAKSQSDDEDMEFLDEEMRAFHNGLPSAVDIPRGHTNTHSVIPTATVPADCDEGKENLFTNMCCPKCETLGPEPCWQHTKHYQDRRTPPLAKASLPKVLRFIRAGEHPDTPTGVSARLSLQSHTVFGPMRGVLCSRSGGKFAIPAKDYRQSYHVESDDGCNWMKYVHFADSPEQQNVAVYMRDNQIYFVTTKDILQGTELKLCYSRKYAETVGVLPRHPLFGASMQHGGENAVSTQNIHSTRSQEVIEHANTALLKQNLSIPVIVDECNSPVCASADNLSVFDSPDGADIRDRSLSPGADIAVHPSVIDDRGLVPTTTALDVIPSRSLSQSLPNLVTSDNSFPTVTENKSSRKRKRKESRSEAAQGKRSRSRREAVTTVVEQTPESDAPIEKGKPAKRIHKKPVRTKPVSTKTRTLVSKFFRDPATVVKYPCEICLTHFKTEALINLHRRFHEPSKEADEDNDADEKVCPDCSERFDSLPDLFRHVESHGKPYYKKERCPVCKKFITTHLLDRHMKGNHPSDGAEDAEKYTCDVCQQAFTSEIKLRAHEQKHKVPKCLICAEICTNWRCLGVHALTHKQADGFHCPCCESTFPTFRKLTAHYHNHHDIRTFCTCEVCGEMCKNRGTLHRHMRQHIERDFSHECDACGKKFRCYSTLRNHVSFAHTVGGRQKIQQTQIRYLKKVDYVAPRKRMLLEEFPLKCDKCQVGFLGQGRYLRHLSKFHPEMPLPVLSGGKGDS